MDPVRLVMSKHALEQIAERRLDRLAVERVAMQPEWTESDPQPGVIRLFGPAPEHGGRVLRVVVADRGLERHVLTAVLDRNARRRKQRRR